MQAIKFDLTRYQKPTTKAKDKRAHLLEQFLARINTEERRTAGYKDVKPARLGMMLSHVDTDDLEAFYKQCATYKGAFSKAFFGALKVKHPTP